MPLILTCFYPLRWMLPAPLYRGDSRAQRGGVHSPRLHSEKQPRFVAQRDTPLNHGPALSMVTEVWRAQSIRLLGSAGNRGPEADPYQGFY